VHVLRGHDEPSRRYARLASGHACHPSRRRPHQS
jgi:hypothetical protein